MAENVIITVDGESVPMMAGGRWLPWALFWSANPVQLYPGQRIPDDHTLAVAGLEGLVAGVAAIVESRGDAKQDR